MSTCVETKPVIKSIADLGKWKELTRFNNHEINTCSYVFRKCIAGLFKGQEINIPAPQSFYLFCKECSTNVNSVIYLFQWVEDKPSRLTQNLHFFGLFSLSLVKEVYRHWTCRTPWWRDRVEIFWLYWPFARGIHRSMVNSPHKGQWRGALMFSFICA